MALGRAAERRAVVQVPLIPATKPSYWQAETIPPLRVSLVPLYVVNTVQHEPLTVSVDVIPIAETVPSGWQMQVLLPASSIEKQHVRPPLPPLPLHAFSDPGPPSPEVEGDETSFPPQADTRSSAANPARPQESLVEFTSCLGTRNTNENTVGHHCIVVPPAGTLGGD